MLNQLLEFIYQNTMEVGAVLSLIIFIEFMFRLIPTKKPINLLALVARLLAKAAILIRRIGNILPENRK